MPEILSMIQVNKMTPAPAVLIVVSYAILLFYFCFLRIPPQLKQRHVAKYCKALEKQTFMNYDKISFINRNIIQIDQYTSTVHVCISVDRNFMSWSTKLFCILKEVSSLKLFIFSYNTSAIYQRNHYLSNKDDGNNYLTDIIL